MPIFTEQVRQNCIGEKCSEHTFLFKINEYFISISAFTGTISELASETKKPVYAKILAQLVQLRAALSSIASIEEEALTKEEKTRLKDLLKKEIVCELYVILQATTFSKYYTLLEFMEIYEKKMAGAETAADKAKYSNRMVKAVMATKIINTINELLEKAPMTPEERYARGYDQTEEERMQKNLNILKGNFKQGIEMEQLTVGRYYSVPGMMQCHQVFAIDTLTGAIFAPKDIERFASFFSASYEQQEQDAVTLDYIYAVPKDWKAQIVTMPKGFKVFPLALQIYPRKQLSAEANKVITRTEIELFTPCLADIEQAKKRTMDPKLMEQLLKLYEDLEKHTE